MRFRLTTLIIPFLFSGGILADIQRPLPHIEAHYVSIDNFTFNPSYLEINRGDVVVWLNHDSVVHTATSESGVFDSRDLRTPQDPGYKGWSYIFSHPGRYAYYCRHHPRMRGVVVVR